MEGEVVISRSLGDSKFDTISVWCITGVHWSNISGGLHKKENEYSLYGYIPYGLLLKKNVACSGRHFNKYNLAKICIPIYKNVDKQFWGQYISLLKEAGAKPKDQIGRDRPREQEPFTKKILGFLSKVPFMDMEELREEILAFGYKKSTIYNAIYYLRRKNKICVVHNLCLIVREI